MPEAPGPQPEAAQPTHRRKRRFAIWLAIIAGFVIVLWWALRGPERSPRPPPSPPVAVTTATAKRTDLPIYLDAIGTVTPVHTDQIASQVTGRVVAVHYTEGQLVHAGEPLVDIDPRPFQATLLQAEGLLERDVHLLEQQRMDLARYREAWAKRAIARQQYEDQDKLVLQTEGTVKTDRGVVDFDRIQLSYCRITAPITGRVGLRLVDPGNLVNAASGTTLAVLTQLQPITVVFSISEDNLTEILGQPNHGQDLPVDVYDRVRAHKLATGRLITFDNQIDTTTGTIRLRAVFDNAGEMLFPNQFVNARLLVDTRRDVTVLPASAIRHDAAQTFVYAIRDGVARVQRVTEGPTEGGQTQVGDLAPGTIVANSGFEKLRDGAAVKTVEPAAPAVGSQP